MKKKIKKRRVYTREFKAEAVALVEKREKSLSQFALEWGIDESILRRWIQKSKEATITGLPAFPGHGNPHDVEHNRLQKETKANLRANEILKKSGFQLRKQISSVKIYQFMQSNKNRYSIKEMSVLFGVSRSAYYKWSKGKV